MGAACTRSHNDLVLSGINAKGLRRRSLWKLKKAEAPSVWLSRLFPLDILLCLSHEVLYPSPLDGGLSVRRQWRTRRLANWIGRHRSDCDNASLLVPTPAIYTWGWTKGANKHRSTRCEQMFPVREYYLIVEFDFAAISRDDILKTDWAPYIGRWSRRGRSVRDVARRSLASTRVRSARARRLVRV
jgi:hypothetical protein